MKISLQLFNALNFAERVEFFRQGGLVAPGSFSVTDIGTLRAKLGIKPDPRPAATCAGFMAMSDEGRKAFVRQNGRIFETDAELRDATAHGSAKPATPPTKAVIVGSKDLPATIAKSTGSTAPLLPQARTLKPFITMHGHNLNLPAKARQYFSLAGRPGYPHDWRDRF